MRQYDYIRRTYGVDPVPGEWVRHTEMTRNNLGQIAPENRSQGHYVMVRFEGSDNIDSPCHPKALEYLGDRP